MKSKELLQALKRRHCREVRQHGSHVRVRCGRCFSKVPVHAGEELGPGIVRAIERDLEPCLGRGWLRK